jgi:hypothetical protein
LALLQPPAAHLGTFRIPPVCHSTPGENRWVKGLRFVPPNVRISLKRTALQPHHRRDNLKFNSNPAVLCFFHCSRGQDTHSQHKDKRSSRPASARLYCSTLNMDAIYCPKTVPRERVKPVASPTAS